MKPPNSLRVIRPLQRRITSQSCRPASPRYAQAQAPLFAATSVSPIRFSSTTSSNAKEASKSTVDPTEVSHFNALASSWWDPVGPSRLLHLMNPLRHTFISRCRAASPSADPTANLRYLDIGCGGGIFAESAARLTHTASVTAIDPTPEVLKIAEAHKRRDPTLAAPGKLTYINTSIEDLPLPKTSQEGYDIVSLFEVLEHVNAPGPFLEHIMPHVKPGGWLVLSTISRTWTSWLVTNIMAEDVLRIVPKGTHDWAKYVNESELRNWFYGKPGWGELKTMGVMYVPGFGWKEVTGSEGWGNYFFAVRREE